MDALRISATDVDLYRRFRDGQDEEWELDLPTLLAQLRRQLPPGEAMAAGSAFHAALERAQTGTHADLTADGYSFDLKLDDEIELPAIRELKAPLECTIGGCQVTLVGKVDAVSGRRIFDHKLTAKFDPDRYLGSFQWLAYLDVFAADQFVWNVFEAKEVEPKRYIVSKLHQLRQNRYPEMRDDVMDELTQFVEFARAHLPERFTRAEAA